MSVELALRVHSVDENLRFLVQQCLCHRVCMAEERKGINRLVMMEQTVAPTFSNAGFDCSI